MAYTMKITRYLIILFCCLFTTNAAFSETLPQKAAAPPQISIEVTGVEDSGVYRSSVTPKIQTDREAKIEVLLNNQPYDYGEVSSEGKFLLVVSVTDSNGNNSKRTISFIIDKTPPISSAFINNPKYYSSKSLFVANTSTIELNAEDSGNGISGVSRIEYSFGNATDWKNCTASIDLSQLRSGPHILYFRSVDKAGNIESPQKIPFILDSTQPTSRIAIGTPQYKNAENKLYISGVTEFSINADDIDSGISHSEYRLDGGLWRIYKEPFRIEDEGDHKLEFRTTDRVGNVEGIQQTIITNDSAPPISIVTLKGREMDYSDIYYINRPIEVLIVATDMISGLKKTEYKIDQGQWKDYAPFVVDDDRNHLISYKSTDNLGNQEITKSLSIHIDKTPPVSTIDIGTPILVPAKGTFIVNDSTFFTISATDTKSGVDFSEYRIDNNEWITYEPFTIQQGGKHLIEYRSTDKAGNTEPPKSLTVMVDIFPPSSIIKINNKPLEQGETIYSQKSVNVSISSSDRDTGIKEIDYRLDDGTWTRYQPFSVSIEGVHLVEFRSTDQLENIEPTKFVKIIVDSTPPVTSLNFEDIKQGEQGQIQISDKTVLSLSATDELSGTYSSEYRIIGRGERQGTEPFSISTAGEYEIIYWSTDRAGNQEKENSAHVKVVITPPPPPPVVTKPTGNPKKQTDNQISQNVSGQQTSDPDIPESIRIKTEPAPPIQKIATPEKPKPSISNTQDADDESMYMNDFTSRKKQKSFNLENDPNKSYRNEYLGIGGINALIITLIFLVL